MTKKKDDKEVILSEELINILNESQQSILRIHDDMQGLIDEANSLVINPSNDDSYELGVELKRKIKSVHIAIKHKKDELKKPFIKLSREIDAFTETVYTPLVAAEKLIKSKIDDYNSSMEDLKLERLKSREEEGQKQEHIDQKLHKLNAVLSKINECTTKQEVLLIEEQLSKIELSEFNERSDEAGFILGNLIQTCILIKKALPDGEPIVNHEEPKTISFNVENTEDQEIPVVLFGETDEKQHIDSKLKDTEAVTYTILPIAQSEDTIEDNQNQVEPANEEMKKEVNDNSSVSNMELDLDFESVADEQAEKRLKSNFFEEE